MDRFAEIKRTIIDHAGKDDAIRAVVAIGSSTRTELKADEYSDLDLFIVTTAPERWYSGEYPGIIGNVSIAFIEPTLGGGKEYRCIYEADLDVDMIVLSPEQMEDAAKEGVLEWVMNRGYSVLYDAQNYAELLSKYVTHGQARPEMPENEFKNIVNDFFFHNIWAYKKLKRGELWSAKMCVDAYLKQRLLRMIEFYCYKVEGRDVWHDGRFIDRWADDWILNDMKKCFAHYESEDVKSALDATHLLFEKVTRRIAEAEGYTYPERAKDCAYAFLKS